MRNHSRLSQLLRTSHGTICAATEGCMQTSTLPKDKNQKKLQLMLRQRILQRQSVAAQYQHRHGAMVSVCCL
jgi:hypothetical protein